MQRLDRGILTAVISLIGIGLVQVYSSSFIYASESFGDGSFFFRRQLIFSFLALLVLFVTAQIPFSWIKKWGWVLWPIATLGVAMTLIPGLGIKAGGAARWLALPFNLRFEPSELLKVALSLFLAFCLVPRKFQTTKNKIIVMGLASLLFLTPLLFILKQPDFGSVIICLSVTASILFVFGLKWRYVLCGVLAVIPAFYFLVMKVPYRRDRVLAFLDPWSTPYEKGFQVIQSMLTFHSGGIFGTGLGQSKGKLFYLPEAHTDFTLAVFGEETGFLGFVLLFGLYGFVILKGFQVSLRAKERFSQALAIGLTMTFALSVFVNVGVVLGLLPTKGLTLPFISYGGSSLVMNAFAMGLLLNVSSFVNIKPTDRNPVFFKR